MSIEPTHWALGIGQATQLAATPLDSMRNALAGRAVTWTNSNPAVASVSSTGLVMALTLGQAIITATSENQSAGATITVVGGLVLYTTSAGGNHTCGVTPDSVAYCWGNNSSGQLGNGSMTSSSTPMRVLGGVRFGVVSAGGNHSCGSIDGAMVCWGDNSFGQLGDGTLTNSAVPVKVLGGLQFQAISAGDRHTCGVTINTAVYCWGDNSFGQLGNGTMTRSAVPVAVGGLNTQVSAGSNHTCSDFALSTIAKGQVSCWGDNSSGQLGDGTTNTASVPVTSSIANSVAGVSAGARYTCALYYSGDAFCWGDNSSGQLGNGKLTSSATPVAVAGGIRFDAAGLRAGTSHVCGGNFARMVYCWGNNSSGQLGDGTTVNRAQPVAVLGGLINKNDRESLSAGGAHTCMATESTPALNGGAGGPAYCWGDNRFGQLGNGTTTNSPIPVLVAHPP